jgi:hypothetical protein
MIKHQAPGTHGFQKDRVSPAHFAGIEKSARMEEQLAVFVAEAEAGEEHLRPRFPAQGFLVAAGIGGAAHHDQGTGMLEAPVSLHHRQGPVLGLEAANA